MPAPPSLTSEPRRVTLSSATERKLATVRESFVRVFAVLACALAVAASCGGSSDNALPTGSEPVTLDPADFTTEITNPYWPMAPGDRWVYREADGQGGEQKVVVTVTDMAKTVMGIDALVVHDVVSEDGQLVEDTFDWYAQDADGNIWYLGEDTKELENGKVTTTAGSWEHGVDGAQAGIAVPANPEPGLEYRQEYYAGEAEDSATVLSVDEWVEVPAGSYREVLMTKDYTSLQPEILEHKLYAKGVGPVLVLGISGGSDREELLSRG
jgi:hypothetical protein